MSDFEKGLKEYLLQILDEEGISCECGCTEFYGSIEMDLGVFSFGVEEDYIKKLDSNFFPEYHDYIVIKCKNCNKIIFQDTYNC